MSFLQGRRIVFKSIDEVVVESFTIPKKPGPDELLVEADSTLISVGTEMALLKGHRNAFPIFPGYSFVGNVLAVGSHVQGFSPGDRVYAQTPHASHVMLKAKTPSLFKVPDPVPSLHATYTSLLAVSLYGLRRAKIVFGESFLILGGGLVGQLCLRLATMTGAIPKVLGDVRKERLIAAEKQGADMLIDMSSDSVQKALAATYQQQGFDVIVDSTGHGGAFLQALQLSRPGGRIVMLGSPHDPITIDNLGRQLNRKNTTIIGCLQPNNPIESSLEWPWGQKRERQLILDLMALGRLDVQSIPVTHIRPEEAPQAYQALGGSSDASLSYVFDWKSSC